MICSVEGMRFMALSARTAKRMHRTSMFHKLHCWGNEIVDIFIVSTENNRTWLPWLLKQDWLLWWQYQSCYQNVVIKLTDLWYLLHVMIPWASPASCGRSLCSLFAAGSASATHDFYRAVSSSVIKHDTRCLLHTEILRATWMMNLVRSIQFCFASFIKSYIRNVDNCRLSPWFSSDI